MLFRTIVKTACLFSLVAVAGCDPDIADVEAEAAEVEAQPRGPSELEAVEEAEAVDPSLELSDADEAEEAAGQCLPGYHQYERVPSGICGGCKINGSYPGQKFIASWRYCYGNGTWSPWQKTTECVDC